MTNLTVTTPSGAGNVNILNCEVSGTFTKSSNADYTVLRLCDLTSASITGAGLVAIFGGNPNFITVNNASANVIVKSAVTVSPVLTAGALSIVDCVVGAAVTNAVTSAASSVITLANSQLLTSALNNVAPVVLNGFYSILNCVYDKPTSTLAASSGTGGTLNSIDYFQYINADKFITQGGTSTQFVKGDGSLDSNYVISFNGVTGAVQGVSSVNGFTGGITFSVGTGITFTASAGTITLSTTGGATGATGATGAQGEAGQSSNYYNYKVHTTTQSPPTGNGEIRYNNATQTSSTILYVDHLDSNGDDIDIFLSLLKQNDNLIIQDASDSNNYQTWKITSAPTVILNDYTSIPVTGITSAGTGTSGFSNNHSVLFIVFSSPIATAYVESFRGLTGAVGFTNSSGIGLSVSGNTLTISNTGVLSFNGVTGAIQGVSSINGSTGAITNVAFTNAAQTFTAAQSFSAGISGSGATFGGSIVLQNNEFIRNSTNGQIDLMPDGVGTTHFGIYFDQTSWQFGVIMGTIRASDGAKNTGGNLRFDVPLTILNDTRFQFGNDGHYGVYRSTTGNDTGQLYALSNNASNSGAIALVNYFAVGNSNRSPGTTHVHPNFYIYANGTTSANDFMRLEHDSTRGIIETGGTSGLTLKSGSGAVAIHNKLILGITGINGTSTPGCVEFDGNVLYAGTTSGRGVVDASHIAFASSAVSLSGVTTYQSIFTSAADVVTLAARTSYIVEGHIVIQSGSTTHTTAVRLLDFTAGVAPIFRLHFLTTGAAVGTVSRAQDTVYFETSGGILNSTSTAVRHFILLRGSIETTDSVTITPQVAFSANPGGTNQTQEGSWIKFTPVGTNTMTSVGPWA